MAENFPSARCSPFVISKALAARCSLLAKINALLACSQMLAKTIQYPLYFMQWAAKQVSIWIKSGIFFINF